MTQSMLEHFQNVEAIKTRQRRLVDSGYPLKIDGIDGDKTKWAQADYERRLAEQPLPPKPWWQSRRMIGLVATIIGTAMGFAGYAVDQALLVEVLTATVTAVGLGTALIGSIKATQPIDTRAVAPGFRVPDRVRYADEELPPDVGSPARRNRVEPSKRDDDDYLGHFGDY